MSLSAFWFSPLDVWKIYYVICWYNPQTVNKSRCLLFFLFGRAFVLTGVTPEMQWNIWPLDVCWDRVWPNSNYIFRYLLSIVLTLLEFTLLEDLGPDSWNILNNEILLKCISWSLWIELRIFCIVLYRKKFYYRLPPFWRASQNVINVTSVVYVQ